MHLISASEMTSKAPLSWIRVGYDDKYMCIITLQINWQRQKVMHAYCKLEMIQSMMKLTWILLTGWLILSGFQKILIW